MPTPACEIRSQRIAEYDKATTIRAISEYEKRVVGTYETWNYALMKSLCIWFECRIL